MSFFRNLFSCTCNNSFDDKMDNMKNKMDNMKDKMAQNDLDNRDHYLQNVNDLGVIRSEIKKIEQDVKTLYRVNIDTSGEMKRLEDKINSHFAILTSKVDSMIMILNTRNLPNQLS